MTYTKRNNYQILGLVGTLIAIANSIISVEESAYAQIQPDNTLGTESTVIKSNDNIRGLPANLIEGGAVRGTNLFHSFLEFNIGDKQRVYFANPPQVENIINRVTGNHPSNIQGTLGVLGNANLFLINPNGIIFGQNARLDIKGSFLASTASSLTFPNGSKFSATNPQAPPLLKINVPVGLQYGTISPQTTISNNGNLVAGRDLTLAAGNLNLQGRLQAGKNLTLQATNTLSVRDSAKVPFIATARENLLVQGDRAVDIFALNNPMSSFFSGDLMILRSAKTIQADAHFRSRGNFRIEQLDGSLGRLLSHNHPVIRANGDVSLDNYKGTSLHIFAGGSVTIPGNILIQGADPDNGIVEDVRLSDGTIASIKGRTQPTLDIRAGTTAVGTPFVDSGTPTKANITIGTVSFEDKLGTVLLTNQYEPNSGLRDGKIEVSSIITNGGSVFIDSKGEIEVNAIFAGRNNSNGGDGGDVILLANKKITTKLDSLISSEVCVFPPNCFGVGGNIILKSDDDIKIFGAISNSSGSNNPEDKQGGNIQIKAKSLLIDSSNTFLGAGLFTKTYGSADAGNIIINARNNVILKSKNPEDTTAEFRSDTFGTGKAGDIVIQAENQVTFDGGWVISGTNESGDTNIIEGKGGDITIKTPRLLLKNESKLSASTQGDGQAGNILVQDIKDLKLFSGSLISTSVDLDGEGNQDAKGNGGAINLNTRSLSLNNAQISASTSGTGNAGSILIRGNESQNADSVSLTNNSQISTAIEAGAVAKKPGAITLNTRSLSLDNGSQIRASTSGTGDAGKITINATEKASFDGIFQDPNNNINSSSGVFTSVGTRENGEVLAGYGKGGNIDITTPELSLTNNAQISASNIAGEGDGGKITFNTRSLSLNNSQISASTSGQGNAGSIEVKNADQVDLNNNSEISTLVNESAEGNGGTINLNTRSLALNNAQISASTAGQGNAGSIEVKNADQVDLNNNSEISTLVNESAEGNGGTINLNTRSLSLNNAQISASTSGRGNAGSIKVENANTVDLTNQGAISTSVDTGARGNGGAINLNTRSLSLNNAQISASTSGRGNAGSIKVKNANTVDLTNQGVISTSVKAGAEGDGGTINLNTRSLSLDNAQISASTSGQGNAGNIKVENAKAVALTNNSAISTSDVNKSEDGQGGNVEINTDSLTLDRGTISATTDSSEGGNIILNINDLFLLRNGSLITAKAAERGSGGNITINAGTIFAIPQQDNDIIANAELGNGGNIKISTQGLFNLEERKAVENNGTNDLDASSDFGVDGEVTIDSPNVDPSRRLVRLPNLTIVPEVLQGCRATTQQTASRFINTGRGGFPPDIEQSNNNTVWEDLRTPTLNAENPSETEIVDESNSTSPVAIVEAQGLIIGSNGEIILSAQPSKVTPYSNLTAPTDCHIR